MGDRPMIKPRIRELPAAHGTRGGELIALAKRLEYRLDAWQCLGANDILATNGENELAAFEAVLLVARQCGKSLTGDLYAILFPLEGQSVLYTSHRADSSKEIFRRVLASLPEEIGARATFTNGKEQILFPSGGVILVRTRGPRVGRGSPSTSSSWTSVRSATVSRSMQLYQRCGRARRRRFSTSDALRTHV